MSKPKPNEPTETPIVSSPTPTTPVVVQPDEPPVEPELADKCLYIPMHFCAPGADERKDIENSYWVTITSDPATATEVENPAEILAETSIGAFGLSSATSLQTIFSDVAPYGLNPDDWNFNTTERAISSTGELLAGGNFVTWINLQNLDFTIEGGLSRIYTVEGQRGVIMECNPSPTGGDQEQSATMSTVVGFSPNAGNYIWVSFGIKLEGSATEVVRECGWFDGSEGIFLRFIGLGAGDGFQICRRYTDINGFTQEEVVPRSQFNDPLDGRGKSKWLLTATRVVMFALAISSVDGGNVEFYIYIPSADNDGRTRWVRFHTWQPGGTSPITTNRALPITFNIRAVNVRRPVRLFRYGVGCMIPKSLVEFRRALRTISGSGEIQQNRLRSSILGIRMKGLFNNIPNSATLIPIKLECIASELCILTVILNPLVLLSELQDLDPLAPILVDTKPPEETPSNNIYQGKELGSFVVGRTPISIDLSKIFDPSRTKLGVGYRSTTVELNEVNDPVITRADALYFVCKAVDASYHSSVTGAPVYVTWQALQNIDVTYYNNVQPNIRDQLINCEITLTYGVFG